MTNEQIEYRNYVLQGMKNYGGDVAQDWDYYNDELGSVSKTISINYCPNCGRKLSDEK